MVVRSPPRDSTEEDDSLLSPYAATASLPGAVPKKKPWVLLVVLAFALIGIIDIGAFLAEPPKTRVFEANLCLIYYREHDPSVIGADGAIPERLCKVDEVQQKMAMIFGWQDMFDALPGLLLAVPFGTLADKIGRKWIFTASLMGLQLNSAWILFICELDAIEATTCTDWNRLLQESPAAINLVLFRILLLRWRTHRRHGHWFNYDIRYRASGKADHRLPLLDRFRTHCRDGRSYTSSPAHGARRLAATCSRLGYPASWRLCCILLS